MAKYKVEQTFNIDSKENGKSTIVIKEVKPLSSSFNFIGQTYLIEETEILIGRDGQEHTSVRESVRSETELDKIFSEAK